MPSFYIFHDLKLRHETASRNQTTIAQITIKTSGLPCRKTKRGIRWMQLVELNHIKDFHYD